MFSSAFYFMGDNTVHQSLPAAPPRDLQLMIQMMLTITLSLWNIIELGHTWGKRFPFHSTKGTIMFVKRCCYGSLKSKWSYKKTQQEKCVHSALKSSYQCWDSPEERNPEVNVTFLLTLVATWFTQEKLAHALMYEGSFLQMCMQRKENHWNNHIMCPDTLAILFKETVLISRFTFGSWWASHLCTKYLFSSGGKVSES